MHKSEACLLVLPLLALVACGQAPDKEAGLPGNAAAHVTANVDTGPAKAARSPAGPPVSAPAPAAQRGEAGARDLLLGFARAIELGRYDEARAMLGEADRQRWSREAFARMFADLPRRSVAVSDGMIDGAAGSLYYTAPVIVTGDDRDGRPVRIEGEAVLRRVNDVDGASPAQLRWHFDRLTLDWTH
ncbi:hypothetical protein [Rhizorhabdus phycosphaerae]|uniref:hypothetical protein n=1 Tax=Rhizorhabdus phycosphaerae TaxID=2711156 RepID=UPI0013EDCED7|nr:hypothetical protein [Rhizorhabdus phycosphaerae]